MKYTLDTAPVLDVYKENCECPLCRLRILSEDSYIESMLSSAYMEPEYRLRTNEIGFCNRHFELMYNRRNRLGVALMTHTHMQEVIKSVEAMLGSGSLKKTGLFSALRGKGDSGADSLPKKIRARVDGCFICEQMGNSIDRYAYTIAQLYFTNNDFKAMFDQSKGFCLPHLALVLEMAEKTLSADQLSKFKDAVTAVEIPNLKRIESELEWFTLKFDYRNNDKPWGNSKDAPERAINKLMGACVGEDAQMPAHND